MQKFKEAFFSVFPIVVLVMLLHFTIAPLALPQLLRFLAGALLIVLGLAIFMFGVEIGIDPIGHLMGTGIARTNRLWMVAVAGLLFGFFISVAEPDLHILAGQVESAMAGATSSLSIVLIVSAGIALMLTVGFIRILYNIPLNKVLTAAYLVILVLSFFTSSEFLPVAFDASGATTGALTVPFILALSTGVSALKKDSKASEKDSFGLVAITSTGAIIAVMIMSMVSRTGQVAGGAASEAAPVSGVIQPFVQELPQVAREVALALAPIVLLFLVFDATVFWLAGGRRRRILLGLVYSFLGLVFLLTGVNAGFMEVGFLLGNGIAALGRNGLLVAVGFLLGLVTVLAEPAVHALTGQIEAVTSGYVKRKTVLAALSIGIGLAVALSMIRIVVPGLKLWHILLPGYLIAVVMAYLTPKLFVGIAFDAGGVASGPMTATFILAFARGAAAAMEGADILLDGFGIISLVALTPLVTLQILGLIYKLKSRKGGMERNGSNA